MLGLLGIVVAASTNPAEAQSDDPEKSDGEQLALDPAYLSYLEHGSFDRYLDELPEPQRSMVPTVLEHSREALQVDSAEVAASMGVPTAQKIEDFHVQEELSELAYELETLLGDDFAGFWFEGSPTTAHFALVAGSDQSEKLVRAAFEESKFGNRLVVQERQHSYSSLTGLLDATIERLRSEGHRFDADASPVTGVVSIYAPSSTLDDLERSLAQSVETDAMSRSDRDRIQLVASELGRPGTAFGGTLLPVGLPYCTSSFVTRNNVDPSKIGPLSAGHCPNDSPITTEIRRLNANPYDVDLVYKGGIYKDRWDVQVYNFVPGSAPVPWFTWRLDVDWPNSGKMYVRQVNSVKPRSTQYIGRDVCAFGYRDFRDCGEIVTRTHCPNYVPTCEALFMKTDFQHGREGSSGGPVYYSNGAWGVISGRHNLDLVYMPINFAAALGGYIWQVPAS